LLLPIPFRAEAVNIACYVQNRNNDGDAAFDGKEHDFDTKKPESEVNVSRSSSAQSRKQDDKTKKEAKGKIPTVGQNSPNNTNTFSVADPLNAAVSPTYGKSSFIDAYKLLDDPDMPELEDITYSDDEDDVGAEADFNNLENSITVKQNKDGIFISQDKYVAEILRTFGLTEGKSASTPIDIEKPLLKDPDGEDVDVHTYRSMIGSLMYLTLSRLDIMFAEQDDKTKKKAKGKSHVESVTWYRDLNAEFKDCFENNSNEVNAAGSIVPTIGHTSFNNTNTFSTAGPSNHAVSPTYRKSSFIDASQLLDDPDMQELEDITYSDDEDVVGAEADFNNLE
nr:hypothetical protein [Tanacetum cinerariifolium]